jgi:hypothetical protein
MKNELDPSKDKITQNLFCLDGGGVLFFARAANKRRVADDEQKTAVAVRAFLQQLRLYVFRNEMMGIMAAP